MAVTKEKPMAPGDTLVFESDWSLPNGHSYKAGDTFTFTLPEQFLIGGAPKGTLSGNNIEYGSYTVSSSGEVVFTFNKAIEEESNISGKFKITSKLKEDLSGTPEQNLVVKVPGAGDLTTEILVKPTKGNSLEKSGKLDQTPNPTKTTWTIDVNKKLDQLTDAKVSDEIPDGLKLIPGSIKVYELNVDLNGTATRGAEVNVSSPTFPLVLPNKNKAYQIVYDTEILEKKNASYTNNASVNINGEKISAASTVNTQYTSPLAKTAGEVNQENRTIEWEVKFNQRGEKIAQKEATFTDEFNGPMDLVTDSVVVKDSKGNVVPSSKYTVTNQGAQKGFKFEFNSDINEAYTIAYKTKVDSDLTGNIGVSNKVTGLGTTAGDNSGMYNGFLVKWHTDVNYEDRTVAWAMDINTDKKKLENAVSELLAT